MKIKISFRKRDKHHENKKGGYKLIDYVCIKMNTLSVHWIYLGNMVLRINWYK